VTSSTPGVGQRFFVGTVICAVLGGLAWAALIALAFKVLGWW
jgi:hypothetical protein